METLGETIMETVAETIAATVPPETVAEVAETLAETATQATEFVETVVETTALFLCDFGDVGCNGYLDDSSSSGTAGSSSWGLITDFTALSPTYVANDVLVNVYEEAAPDLDDDEEYQA